jgi:hypothetical protein
MDWIFSSRFLLIEIGLIGVNIAIMAIFVVRYIASTLKNWITPSMRSLRVSLDQQKKSVLKNKDKQAWEIGEITSHVYDEDSTTWPIQTQERVANNHDEKQGQEEIMQWEWEDLSAREWVFVVPKEVSILSLREKDALIGIIKTARMKLSVGDIREAKSRVVEGLSIQRSNIAYSRYLPLSLKKSETSKVPSSYTKILFQLDQTTQASTKSLDTA